MCMIQYDIAIFAKNMINKSEIGGRITAAILTFSLAACSGGETNKAGVHAASNATPVSETILLGCKPIEFGDQAINVAKSFEGDPNSFVSINGGEKKPVMKASILPFDAEGNVQNEICVYSGN